jgi:hypothetical protein
MRIVLLLERAVKLIFRRQADYMLPMRILAKVVDHESREPLSGVRVIFLDRSFDYRRARDPERHALPIGESGPDGRVDALFRYFWGAEVVWLSKSRVGNAVTLRFVRDGFEPAEWSFDPWRLPYEEHVLQVRIPEDVALKSVHR